VAQSDFDFDAWCDLAQRDPAAYFRERERVIAAFIDDNPEQRERLLAMQAQIDGLRATAGTPDRALAGIVGLMGDHLAALAGQFAELRKETDRLRALMARRSS
jgi:hypothetical protein